MAAIFDSQHTQTSDNILVSLSVLPDPKNMAEPLEFRCYHVYKSAVLDFRLPVSSGRVTDSTIDKFDPENMGVPIRISFLASLEAEIHLGWFYLTPSLQHKRQ